MTGPVLPREMHTADGHCPVVDALVSYFGKDYGGYLLYNYTCFPCDDRVAFVQAGKLIDADRRGKLRQYVRYLDRKIDKAMREAAARA